MAPTSGKVKGLIPRLSWSLAVWSLHVLTMSLFLMLGSLHVLHVLHVST